jgi:hypothetical protein
MNRDCAIGQRCLLDANGAGACSLELDACRAMSDCAAGLACVDAECSNPCTTVTQCPSDSSCVAGTDHVARCVPSTIDAGASDAPAIDAPPDAGGPAVVALAAGYAHACMILEGGALYCWGAAGAVPDGMPASAHGACMSGATCVTRPTRVLTTDGAGHPTPLSATHVSCGYANTLVIDPAAHAFDGSNANGFLDMVRGADTAALASVDRVLSGDGFQYFRVLGPPIAWIGEGYDDHAQVAAPPTTSLGPTTLLALRPDPTDVVALGGQHACALRAGNVYCWGRNLDGECGAPPSATVNGAMQVASLTSVTEIAVSGASSCALVNGSVSCWGRRDGSGTMVLGRDCGGSCNATPVSVALPSGTTITHIFGGGNSDTMCAEDSAQQFWCWGSNGAGQIVADPTMQTIFDPLEVPGLAGASMLALGADFYCALVGGVVQCAGNNDTAQLGRGTSTAMESFGPITMP